VARFGPQRVIVTAMLVMAGGMALLTGIAPGGTYAGSVLAGATLTALGMGFSLVPSTIVAMQGVAGADSGVASGLLNTSRLMGGALGLAVLSTIASGQTRADVAAGGLHALTAGFDLAFTVAIGIALAGAAIAAVALRPESPAAAVRLAERPAAEDEAAEESVLAA
jgi:MFS family permease